MSAALTSESVLDAILEMAAILDAQPVPSEDRYIWVHKSWHPMIHAIWGWKRWAKRRGVRGRRLALKYRKLRQ